MALRSFGRAPLEWWEHTDAHYQLADLIAWLHEEGRLGVGDEAIAEVIYTCRKPWKFTTELEAMKKARLDLEIGRTG